MEVSKELRADIAKNQNKLKVAITNHQILIIKLKADPDNVLVKYDIQATQNDIISIGLDQKELIERIRKEFKQQQKIAKTNATKVAIEERRCNLSNILTKTRKQTLTTRSGSVSSASEDSQDGPSGPPSPTPPLLPHELTQVDFLGRMGLCTPEVFKELQNKRVERKRRSTANPQFLYGNRWDQTTKRRKNAYLLSMSPPNTRQAVKNKLKAEQRVSPPPKVDSRSSSPVNKKTVPIGLNIPNLPSGLTIERINGSKTQPPDNSKVCLVCRSAGGGLSVCETCNGFFHIGCHNRPLVQQPRHCPKCLGKRDNGSRDVGSLSVPPSMTVLTTYVPAEVKEKAQEQKRVLLEQNRVLNDDLCKLEDRAAQLTAALASQADTKQDMLEMQRQTHQNIERLLTFVHCIKGKQEPQQPATSPVATSTSPPRASPLTEPIVETEPSVETTPTETPEEPLAGS